MSIEEVWRDIGGYEGLYQVSNFGRVRSLDRQAWNGKVWHDKKGVFLSLREHNAGYLSVALSKEGKIDYFLVHRLVGEAFLERGLDKSEVNHIDENKHNNHVENLEWVTPKENMNHGTRVERCLDKFKETGFVKKVVQMDLEGNFIAEYESQIEASRQTGVRQGSISSAVLGKYKTAGGYKWKFKEEPIGGEGI